MEDGSIIGSRVLLLLEHKKARTTYNELTFKMIGRGDT